MTVAELIEDLADYGDDAEVFVVQTTRGCDKFFVFATSYTSHPTDPDANDVVQIEISETPESVKS